MSQEIVALLGFLTIASIVTCLFKSKTHPAIAFITFPSILAIILVLGGYYTVGNINTLIKGGFSSTSGTAALFVFSVLYFGIMSDTGMFDVIINKLMKYVGTNVVHVCVVTAIIALIAHLDGGGASTFCIVIPAMLPVFKKMGMRPTSLLTICTISMGVLNLMPWAGPTMRAASVLGMDASALWRDILPVQAIGVAMALGTAFIVGMMEKKRGAGSSALTEADTEGIEAKDCESDKNADLKRFNLFAVNLALTVGIIALLVWGKFPGYFPFMIGCASALFINYGASAKLHKRVINLHAGPALMMCSTLMGAAVLMGVLVKTAKVGSTVIPSVVTCMSATIAEFIPEALGSHLSLLIGFLSVPLALCFDTDSYFYGMLPIMIGIGQQFNVSPESLGVAMVICRNCATFISPMVPATLLGCGLAEVDIKDHIKATFLWVWGFSIICMIFSIAFGIMQL